MVENEIGFLRARAFREKAPAIARLEIRRLERMIGRFDQATTLHNALVRARYELRRFVEQLDEIAELPPAERRRAIEDRCTPPLEAAMLALSGAREEASAAPAEAPSSVDDPAGTGAREPAVSAETDAEHGRGDRPAARPLDGEERPSAETLQYVLDRLRYVYDRLHLMYD